jgi:NodT family efflux transporter outer membrane factor (OMF) lipoprotein
VGRFVFLFFLLFLCGCCTQLSKRQKCCHFKPTPCLPVSTTKALQTPYFALGDWPAPCWWQEFKSPALDELIATALAQNPRLHEVRARIEQAKNVAIISRSRLFPLIYFNYDETWTYLSKNGLYRALNPTIPRTANLIDLTLSFTYEFDFWGKNHNLFYADLDRAIAEVAELRQAELIVSTALAQVYFALKTNLWRKTLLERLVTITAAYADLEVYLSKKALRSGLPPLLTEERALEAKKRLLAVDDEIEQNIHLINVLAGRGPDCPFTVDALLEPLPACMVIPEDLCLSLLARRPDLRAQLWRAEALSHEVGAAIADFYPDFNLSAFVGLESLGFSRLFRASSATATLKPAISLPIFTAGAIGANVQAQKARFDAVVFAYNTLILQSVQEVADVLSFGRTVYSQEALQQQIVKKAKERFDLATLLQQKGLDNQLSTWLLEIEYIERNLEEAALLYNQYVASVKLIKALGGGYASL